MCSEYRQTKVMDSQHCGYITADHFTVDLNPHTEAVKFNSCLNRKVSIDTAGNIKNCPSQTANYGNIENTSIADAIKETKFKRVWTVKKDDISVCRDCEHRYICTDCRIFTQDKNDLFSKPAKCTYVPYRASWN